MPTRNTILEQGLASATSMGGPDTVDPTPLTDESLSFVGFMRGVGRRLSMSGGYRPNNGGRSGLERDNDSLSYSSRHLEGQHRGIGGSPSLHRAGIHATSISSSFTSPPLHGYRSGALSPSSYSAVGFGGRGAHDASSHNAHSSSGPGHSHATREEDKQRLLEHLHTHFQDDIRQTTMELAQGVPGSFASEVEDTGPDGAAGTGGFIFPTSPILSSTTELPFEGGEPPSGPPTPSGSELEPSLSSLSDFGAESRESLSLVYPRKDDEDREKKKPSGLSLLRPTASSSSTSSSESSPRPELLSTPRPPLRSLHAHDRFDSLQSTGTTATSAESAASGTSVGGSFYTASPGVGLSPSPASPPLTSTPRARPGGIPSSESVSGRTIRATGQTDRGGRKVTFEPQTHERRVIGAAVGERTPLLVSFSPPSSRHGLPPTPHAQEWHTRLGASLGRMTKQAREFRVGDVRDLAKVLRIEDMKTRLAQVVTGSVKSVPAVLLGCLLNILDGVSYGMILFPSTPPFTHLGPMGVSMFFVSAVIAQLVYTAGGSGFAGGNGSMMIEVVPFFHILAADIAAQIGDGEDKAKEVVATTLVAYAFSSVLTGVTFFLLGALKLGVLVGFFPRHILVGCIGGVGVFLIITGFAVSTRLPEDALSFSLDTFRTLFLDTHNLVLWTLPLGLAVLLRVITARIRHQLVFPAYFIFIPALFYVVVLAARFDLGKLREQGWLFDVGAGEGGSSEPWWTFYTYYDLRNVHFTPLWMTLPTQFALLFFNILHPPLNVPALAVSLDMDVDTNKELVGHGYSNLVSGLLGTVPNYLVYVNTLLFYRVGGETRLSSFLLMLATIGLLVIGTGPIAYLPVIVVGALIFVLGIDLVKEALWDTRHRVSRSEYITIVSIMVCMTAWDFVVGVLFGIVVSCFFFVVQNSHRRSIRAVFTGDTAMSAVRRPSIQRAYIREVAKQTTIMRLQGFLFFGTITYVEETIRDLIAGPSYTQNPVRYLVLDFTLVAGVDMSSAEALVRVQRLLSSKCVTLVICGVVADSPVSKSLESVGLVGADYVELFGTFNDAMEWTENEYLSAWYRSQKLEISGVGAAAAMPMPTRRESAIEYHHPLSGSIVKSPRRSHIRDVGDRTIATEMIARQEAPHYGAEPLNTLIKAFSSYGAVEPHRFGPISNYFERLPVPTGHVLWRQNDPSDGLYVVESGILRASYDLSRRPGGGDPSQHDATGGGGGGGGGDGATSARPHESEGQQQLQPKVPTYPVHGGGQLLTTFEESMVAGTVAGELSALSDSPRNATVVVEQPAVLWKLSTRNLNRMQVEQPDLAREFMRLVLKAAKVDYDILLSAIASRQ